MTEIEELNYMKNDLVKRREQFAPKDITSHSCENFNSYFYFSNNVKLKVEMISDTMIRFRYAIESEFDRDFSYAIDFKPEVNVEFYEFEELPDHFRITTDKLIFTIQKSDGIKKILNRSGVILNEDEKGFHWEYYNKTGNNIILMSNKIQPSEYFYGLGDKSGHLNLRGRKLELWGSDTYAYDNTTDPLYKNIPFFMSLHKGLGYGIFFDNTFRSHFDFGKERGNVFSFWAQGGEMNYYFIYGPELISVSEQYALLTGTPELPPLWALGFHQCKWSYFPDTKVKEITRGFRDRKIPCDAIYLDIDYMEGFRCFTWSKEHFPEPKKMIEEFNEEGFKTIVIIDPGIKIDNEYPVYKEAIENDYFCRRADGPLMKGSVWPGLCNFPDFTKPEVRTWWAGLFKELIKENKVAGVWNDMNEPAVFEEGTFPDDVRFDYDGASCSHLKAHNVYGMQMARATYEGIKQNGYPNRPFVITRSGYSGMQRYSSVWTGDNVASFEHLQIANAQCQRLSVSGVSFTGSDIGGFIETPTPELFTRWIQLGVFHPFCRVHSSGDHGEQEPWSFGEEATEIVKKFIEIRYQLLPYIYTAFWQYSKYGTPMLRPLAFLNQNNPESYFRQEEFGLGDNLLICPILEEKAEGRWMYLPAGQWYNFWSDEVNNGNDEIWAEAKIDSIPIFVKAGAVIPFYPVQQYVGEKKIETLTLHIYNTKGQNTSKLYEDAGNGYDYSEQDLYNIIEFNVERKDQLFYIKQLISGSFKAEYTTYNIVLHGFNQGIKVISDNKELNLRTVEHHKTTCHSFIVSRTFDTISIKIND